MWFALVNPEMLAAAATDLGHQVRDQRRLCASSAVTWLVA